MRKLSRDHVAGERWIQDLNPVLTLESELLTTASCSGVEGDAKIRPRSFLAAETTLPSRLFGRADSPFPAPGGFTENLTTLCRAVWVGEVQGGQSRLSGRSRTSRWPGGRTSREGARP